MSNQLSTVQQIYACFAQGDIPGILANLAEEVTFFNGADPKVAPFGGTFHGKNEVINFFTALGRSLQTTHFEPSNFREAGNQVINEVQHDGIAIHTGKPFSVKTVFTWTFNEQGLPVEWKGVGDFTSMNDALLN
ncbi:MAG TPA: nuclear transport factor 2 family protein [Saprospiraceae bacterium]|nr:nuclear transport factor 2 family protein [Saprospiraceae bacterium]HMQ84161.1 nuclear transport factor 2 family protein [Saprospiraceae bacterium]